MKTAVVLLVAGIAARADIHAVKAELNLEKRSDRALQNAEQALDRARDAYQKGDDDTFKADLDELGQSMDLCKQSLDESGKNARKNPKYFKKAEMGMRHLIRRLDNFKIELSVDDRDPVEKLIDTAHRLQDEILHAIMGKKK